MDPEDLRLRNLTYGLFVDLGRAPTSHEVAAAGECAPALVQARWRRLHDQHALVLGTDRKSLRMANPFSAVPTRYRVRARGRWWFGNCAWDAFGICAALHGDGRIETSCPDCEHPIAVEVRGERPDDESLIFHCLVTAEHWWEDIVFT
jgi:hypothetical protein